MRVVIPDWIVADEEIVVPKPGVVLQSLGLRLHDFTGAIEAPRKQQTVRGIVAWLRDDMAEELFEMVVDTGPWAVLTQEPHHTRRAANLVVGGRVSLIGRLQGVAEYEYKDFSLPDVRANWLVLSASQNEETLEWHVDLDPSG